MAYEPSRAATPRAWGGDVVAIEREEARRSHLLLVDDPLRDEALEGVIDARPRAAPREPGDLAALQWPRRPCEHNEHLAVERGGDGSVGMREIHWTE